MALVDGPAIGMAVLQCGPHMTYSLWMAIFLASGSDYSGFPPYFGPCLIIYCRRFDVPVFYGREIIKCEAFAREWYGVNLEHSGEVFVDIVFWRLYG